LIIDDIDDISAFKEVNNNVITICYDCKNT